MRRAVLQRRTSKVWEVSCGIQGDRHLQQVSAAHCLGRRFRLRLLQDSRQGGLPLLPPQVSWHGLLGSVSDGEPIKRGRTLPWDYFRVSRHPPAIGSSSPTLATTGSAGRKHQRYSPQSKGIPTFSLGQLFNGRRVSALPIQCGNPVPFGQCTFCSHSDRRKGSGFTL